MSEGNINTGTSTNENQNDQRPKGIEPLKQYINSHKIDTLLWLSRGFTVVFCFLYILPIFSSPSSSYHKALMGNAASSALRLHQRIPNIQFTREFLGKLILEDSAHYLFFAVIFMYSAPITMVLVPIFMFALLHFASYSLVLLDVLGKNNALGSRFFISLVEYQQRNMLRGAAFVEIMLMPVSVFSLFYGGVSFLTPVLYYRFLTMRYTSRRNAYTRTIFYELRVTTEYAINHPIMPAFLRNLGFKVIAFVSNLSPPIIPVNTNAER